MKISEKAALAMAGYTKSEIEAMEKPQPAPQPAPMPDHAVLIAEDEVTVSRLRLIDGGQGLHAPPGVVVRRPRVETVPVVIL